MSKPPSRTPAHPDHTGNRRRVYKGITAAFVVYCLGLGVLAAGTLRDGIAVETSIQAMVPQARDNPAVAAANDVLDERFANLVVLALSGDDKAVLERAETAARALVSDAGEVKLKDERTLFSRYEALADVYRPYRFALLAPGDRALLLDGDTTPLVRQAARDLVDLHSGRRIMPFGQDPLGLFGNFFQSLPFFDQARGPAADGYLIDPRGERPRFVKPLLLEVAGDAQDMDEQRTFVARMDSIGSALEARFPSVTVHRSGLVFHSDYAAQRSKREFTLISIVSMIAIVSLFVGCFRSPRPLLLGVGSLAFSAGAALLVSDLVFSKIHILTLVFGAGLIGVAIDYSLHYFAHESFGADGGAVLPRVLPSLAMGMVTTVAGYCCLYQTSMPALYEVATFCITGLISAWLFVVAVYPRVRFGVRSTRAPALVRAGVSALENIWRRAGIGRSRAGLGAVVLIGAVVLVGLGESNNNVRLLYEPPPHIMEQDRLITSLLPERSANQYFVVESKNAEQLLQLEERLGLRLESAIQEGALSGYAAISRYVPSLKRQRRNRALRAEAVYAPGGAVTALVARFGLGRDTHAALDEQFTASAGRFLTPERFLAAAPGPVASLWLGERGDSVSSMVSLSGIRDLEAVSSAADGLDGITFVDRVAGLSSLLERQHRQASRLLVGAYLVIALIVAVRYRRARAFGVVLIPAAAAVLTLTGLTLFSVPLSLFHVLALYLALGLGLDYGIFLYDSNGGTEARIAIALSAATSALSFGLLSLSSTPMIADFGLTVLLAVTAALLLSPLLVTREPEADR